MLSTFVSRTPNSSLGPFDVGIETSGLLDGILAFVLCTVHALVDALPFSMIRKISKMERIFGNIALPKGCSML